MKLVNILFLVSVVLLLAATGLLYTKLSPTNELILHFTPGGQPDYTGSLVDVFGALVTGGVVVLLNYVLSRALRIREEFFSIALSITGLLVSLLLFAAVFVIVINNQ